MPAVGQVRVEIKGIEKVKRDLERRTSPTTMRREGNRILTHAGRNIVAPVLRGEVPPPNPSSPWRRGKADGSAKTHGRMGSKISVKAMRLRKGEFAAVQVGIPNYATNVVVRGQRPHWQPKRHWQHPGNHITPARDMFGRTRKRTEKQVVAYVQQEIVKL